MLEDINNTYRIRSSCAVYNISIHPNNSVLFHYLIPLCSGAERLSAALALSLYYIICSSYCVTKNGILLNQYRYVYCQAPI